MEGSEWPSQNLDLNPISDLKQAVHEETPQTSHNWKKHPPIDVRD